MSTQKCKDCGNQVSKRAKQCPHCGAPVKKKSGCLGVTVLLFLVAVVIGIISSALDDGSSPTPAQTAAAPEPKEKPKPTPPPSVEPKTKTEQPQPTPKPAVQPERTAPDWKARQAELKAQYLPEFQRPTVGSRISLKLKNGSKQQGVVKKLTEDMITIGRDGGTSGFMKSQLSTASRVRCFASDYATYKAYSQIKLEKAEREAERKRKLAERQRRAEQERRRVEARRAQEKIASAQLVLHSWSWSVEHGYVTAEGQVSNISGRKLENVQAVAQLYASDKKFITSGTGLLEYNPLMPGQTSPFKVMLRHNPMMKSASISFKIMWGGRLNYVTKEEYDEAKE